MEHPDRITDLLDKASDDALSREEQQELETLLKDPAHGRLAADYHLIREALSQAGRDSLREKMQAWDTKMAAPKTRVRRVIPIWAFTTAAAAAVALLILILWPSTAAPPSALIAELSSPYPNVLMPVERGTRPDHPLEQAFAAYEREDYAGFLDYLEAADSSSAELRFYEASARWGNGETEAALEGFTELAQDGPFADQAAWYVAMIWWQQGKKEEADTAIRRMANQPQHEMNKRARRWLGEDD